MVYPERETLTRLCRGDEAAVALIEGTWLLASVYDDAIDGDKKRSDDEIHNSFLFAMVGLRRNAVYRKHPELEAVLLCSVACWRAANRLERSAEREAVHSAYVLRCSPYQFFVAVVFAVAGMEAAIETAEFFYGRTTDDSLEVYLAEHMNRAAAQKGV